MRVFLDRCVPYRLGRMLQGHQVSTAAELRWDRLRNGALLTAAAGEGFDALVTVDQGLKHQQNLKALPFAVVVVRARSNDINDLAALVRCLDALKYLTARTLVEVPGS